MDKYNFFIGSMKAKAHYQRRWMLRAFTVVLTPTRNGGVTPEDHWMLRHTTQHVEVCVPNNGQFAWEVLEGAKPYDIPFVYHDPVPRVVAGDVENLKQDITDATWGDLLFNSRVLVYAAGEKIPYRIGPIDLGKLEEDIISIMVSNVPEDQEDDKTIYVRNYQRFGKAISDLAGYEIFIPSVTEAVLQAPADNVELRDKLFEENKDTLDDPVTHVKIQDALVKNYIDKCIKGTPAEGFLYKTKSLNTALKRMFLIHGPEAGFNEGGRAVLVPTSLQEQTDLKYYPEMVNSLRAGSYFRGALTAMAGEDVDLFGRIFQNAKIVPGYCGTQDTWSFPIITRNLGRNLLIDGEVVKITPENIEGYLGTVQPLLSPMYCLTEHGDMCEVCAGKKLTAYRDGVGSMMQDMPSTMMARMMASAHAKALKTVRLDIKNFLR